MPQDYTLLLFAPGQGSATHVLDDAEIVARLAAAARATEIELGHAVRAVLLAAQAGHRCVRLEAAPERSRWGPFWLEAELGFPEFRLLRQLAIDYEVTAVAYSERLQMGWLADARGSDLSLTDLQNEPLPPDIKGLVDLLVGSPVVREITLADAPASTPEPG